MSGCVPVLRAATLTAHENVMRRSLLLFPPFSLLLHAPLRPTASQPRDQLQALMKRQSGN